MERIIIFRFHDNPAICTDRLRLIRKFNPGIAIYGIYGGDPERMGDFAGLGKYFENLFSVANETADWKWKNSDLALRAWFGTVGKNIVFDMLHLIEWDLLFFDSIDVLYRDIPADALGLTALVPLDSVEKKWVWTSRDPYVSEWRQLLALARDGYGYSQKPMASLGPGCCLPRSFLERYCALDVPSLCHDELRLPLFGQVLGFKLCDTGFYKKWFDGDEHRFFNCLDMEIDPAVIVAELEKNGGRRVFHPFRKLSAFRI